MKGFSCILSQPFQSVYFSGTNPPPLHREHFMLMVPYVFFTDGAIHPSIPHPLPPSQLWPKWSDTTTMTMTTATDYGLYA